jgi:hypothetical protein
MGMKNKAIGTLITYSGEVKEMEFSKKMVTLKEMQDCVGGYIEFVWLNDNKILVVNEDGKIVGLPDNMIATTLIMEQGISDHIVGNALLIDRKYVD